ncbi:MAG: 50S ribosomal protein L9 [Parcubacteria group bacterium]|jgi:large subunit ribosomal protein L9|nr:50S ribosomal protein L9 [Parcubacteria group bacterium]
MKVILKQDVKGVGRKFEIKDVSAGYANNFLIPNKLAEHASPEAVKRAEISKMNAVVEMEIKEKLAEKQIETLKNVAVVLKKKSNEKGNLFEQVHPDEIVKALKEQASIEIGAEFLSVEEPIKEIGEHTVLVSIGSSKTEFKVIVEKE